MERSECVSIKFIGTSCLPTGKFFFSVCFKIIGVAKFQRADYDEIDPQCFLRLDLRLSSC